MDSSGSVSPHPRIRGRYAAEMTVIICIFHVPPTPKQRFRTELKFSSQDRVLEKLANFLHIGKPQRHSIGRLKERRVEKGSCRCSTFRGQERLLFHQTHIDTVSRAALGTLPRDGTERAWACPSAVVSSSAKTEIVNRRTWKAAAPCC